MATDLTTIDEGAVLRIVYETDELVSVRTVATILDRLGVAFEAYAKASVRFRGTRLAVFRIEIGSLVASLVAVGEAVETLIKQREAIGGFLNHMNDVLQMMLGNIPGTPKAADRKAVEAITGPIANGNASQISIMVIGDGNSVTVGEDVVQKISQQLSLDAERKARSAKSIAELTGAAAPNLLERPRAAVSAVPSPFESSLMESGAEGEAIRVRGNWYVRLDGQGGVMHPADLAPEMELHEGGKYLFKGKWNVVRYDIASAIPI